MAGLLSNFRNTFIVGFLLAVVMIVGFATGPHGTDGAFIEAVMRWLHVFFGILWIGLLYYFNFVQIRVMPQVPAELKPGVSKYIAPEALFWFRYAALATVIMGLIIAFLPAAALASASASTRPSAIFWAGQMKPQTLNIMIMPSHMPRPSRA